LVIGQLAFHCLRREQEDSSETGERDSAHFAEFGVDDKLKQLWLSDQFWLE
jgi:hypothetical protein